MSNFTQRLVAGNRRNLVDAATGIGQPGRGGFAQAMRRAIRQPGNDALLLEPSIKQHRAAVGMGLSLGWRTFALERKRASVILPRSDWGVLDSGTEGDHRPVSTTRRLLSKNTARMGDEGKAVGCAQRRRLCCLSERSIPD